MKHVARRRFHRDRGARIITVNGTKWPTKDKLAAQRHTAKFGRRVHGELKRIEGQLMDAEIMPDD